MDSHQPSDEGAAGAFPDPERFWAEVLSGKPQRIRAALDSLSEEDAVLVQDHLRRMATEEGWQPAQRRSARAALDQIEATDGAEA